jgi:HAD superfamily hydrolase (TIGR01509 family)
MDRAIIFDFNGVLADDETPHIVCFQQALAEVGLTLTADEYYGTYLGMDERSCTALLLTTRDGRSEEALLNRIMERKIDLFRRYTAEHKPRLFPGVVRFVKQARSSFRVAVASGGRRQQIEDVLAETAIEQDFETIVSADDCSIGKPDPAIYLLALQHLNDRRACRSVLTPGDCLVFEDSTAGIQAAHAAGMAVVGVATTYPPEQLREADLVVPNLENLSPEDAWRCGRRKVTAALDLPSQRGID